ncbi:12800_t:CDS:2, partial [Ambispora gerdemannii]
CCVAEFDVVVSPKRTKGFKWTVNIEHATLEALKDSIHAVYQTPALENDGAVFNVVCDSRKYSPRNDQALREMLRLLVSKNNLKFTVFIETPSKAFNNWTFPKVCQLYNLSEDPNPDVSVFPTFSCGCSDTKNVNFQVALDKLMVELQTRLATTPINLSYEATKTIYTYSYLASAVSLFETLIRIRPEKLIEGKNGQGKTDYAMESCATGRIIDVVEVKREDFLQGIAQASVQMESSLASRKRKVDELETEQVVGSVFAIVTDAKEFYFLECTLDDQEKPSFKLSKPAVVVYEDEDMKVKVEKVLSHIVWLLEEVQKADELEGGNKRVKHLPTQILFCARIHNEATNWFSRSCTQRNERDINPFLLYFIRSSSATMNSIKHVNFVNDIRRVENRITAELSAIKRSRRNSSANTELLQKINDLDRNISLIGYEVRDIKNGVGSRDSNSGSRRSGSNRIPQDYTGDIQILWQDFDRLFKEKRRLEKRTGIPKFQKK